MAIPPSALAGDWLADRIGVLPLFAFGGAFLLALAVVAGFNPHLRSTRIA